MSYAYASRCNISCTIEDILAYTWNEICEGFNIGVVTTVFSEACAVCEAKYYEV